MDRVIARIPTIVEDARILLLNVGRAWEISEVYETRQIAQP